jgi:hypothetical protein
MAKTSVKREIGKAFTRWKRIHHKIRAAEVDADEDCDEGFEERKSEEEVNLVELCLDRLEAPGYTLAVLKRIKSFLFRQGRGRDKAKYEVTLTGPGCPGAPRVYVDELGEAGELDLAYLYEMISFESIRAVRQHDGCWTKRRVKDFLEEVLNDFHHDGFNPVLTHELLSDHELEIVGKYDEDCDAG